MVWCMHDSCHIDGFILKCECLSNSVFGEKEPKKHAGKQT